MRLFVSQVCYEGEKKTHSDSVAQDVRDDRALESKESTPGVVDEVAQSEDGNFDLDKVNQSGKEENPENQIQMPEKSQLTRKANIAKNVEQKKGTKGKNKEKAPSRTSEKIPGHEAEVYVNTASALWEHGVMPSKEGQGLNVPGPPSSPIDPPHLQDSPTLPTVTVSSVSTNALPLLPIVLAPPLQAVSAAVPLATSTLTTDGNIGPTPETRSMDVDNVDEAMSLSAPTPAANDHSKTGQMGIILASALAPLATSTPTTDGIVGPTPATGSMDVDNVNEGTSLSAPTPAANDQDSQLNTDQMDVDKTSGATDAPQSGSTNVDDTSKIPTWLSGNGMLEYLRGVSDEKAWQQLVSSFVKFETCNTAAGVCN